MVSAATARPTTFSFHLSIPNPKPKPHLHTLHFHHHHHCPILRQNSIPVSKEDKPISQDPILSEPISPDSYSSSPNLDPRRLDEKFAVLNTGIHECRSCGYRYDEVIGDPVYPIPPGLGFGSLPVDWRCPTCGAAKGFFESKSVEVAGFAVNQKFGFGTNGLTAGQKGLLIWGSLAGLFLLFLSGYFLQ